METTQGLVPEASRAFGFWRIRETPVRLNLGSFLYQLCGIREIIDCLSAEPLIWAMPHLQTGW